MFLLSAGTRGKMCGNKNIQMFYPKFVFDHAADLFLMLHGTLSFDISAEVDLGGLCHAGRMIGA